MAKLKQPNAPVSPSFGKPLGWQEALLRAQSDPRVVNARERLEQRTWELCGRRTADPRIVLSNSSLSIDAERSRLSREYRDAVEVARAELMGGGA